MLEADDIRIEPAISMSNQTVSIMVSLVLEDSAGRKWIPQVQVFVRLEARVHLSA